MANKYWIVPKSKAKSEAEIGSYEVSGNLTDFPRGVFLAYADKGLVTGLASREEAESWLRDGVYNEQTDTWTTIPERVKA